MTDARKIREYPMDRDSVEYDLPNQILFDLKGTFGWRAIGEVYDGKVSEWYAYHNDIQAVVEWWPYHFEEPVWHQHSIYAFSSALKYADSIALYEWPSELDENAEVLL